MLNLSIISYPQFLTVCKFIHDGDKGDHSVKYKTIHNPQTMDGFCI